MATRTGNISEFGLRIGKPAIVQWLAASFFAGRDRWMLWVPVFFGAGAGVYLALPAEPGFWTVGLAFGAAAAGCWWGRRRIRLLLMFLVAAVFTAGIGAGQIKSSLVSAPVIAKKTGLLTISGRVLRAEPKDGAYRLWLEKLSISRLAPERTPAIIRVKTHIGRNIVPVPGQRVTLRAVLYPPSGPAAPGAFDFARRSWFQRIGGVGYAVAPPEILAGENPAGGFRMRIARLRHMITVRIQSALPGVPGAVAAALLTGERGAIPEDVLKAMRESGLAHLLAISGLHLGLVGGLLFFAVRFFLSLMPPVALRYPIKKWAAILALAGSFFYLLISGGTLPTQRAFLMIGLVFLAVLLDRNPISLNLVAWAAMAILLIAPESVANVSFQMSFAAVIALVAAYESTTAKRFTAGLGGGVIRRGSGYFFAVLMTTVIAGLATAPFALFHFNQTALYGVLGNALAVPLTAFWVMPAGIMALMLMAAGLEEAALWVMGAGIENVVAVARWVSSLPGAIVTMPAVPVWPLVMLALGGLWLSIWRSGWRYLGLGLIAGGMALAAATIDPPDILVSETGKKIAVKGQDGRLVYLGAARGFVSESWARRNGETIEALLTAKNPEGRRNIDIQCDRFGCIYRHPGGAVVGFSNDIAALAEDCRTVDIMIAAIPVRRRNCAGPAIIIDRFSLWRFGAHEIRFRNGAPEIRTVHDAVGNRPWNRYPGPRR